LWPMRLALCPVHATIANNRDKISLIGRAARDRPKSILEKP
jgi:hypothetical protein